MSPSNPKNSAHPKDEVVQRIAHPKDGAYPKDGAVNPKATEDDTEGHEMGLMHPVAWELGKAKQAEVARDASRHSLINAAKSKVRRKS
jgi:hypothetical protein